jgi:hypothetical protein
MTQFFVFSNEELQKRRQREYEMLLKHVIVEPKPWHLVRAISRSPYVGKAEILRGAFLPDRPIGRILWWPARLGSHRTGIHALGIDRQERLLEIEVNRTDDGFLSYFPYEGEEPIIRKFLAEPSLAGHDDGYIAIRGRRLYLEGCTVRLARADREPGSPAGSP